MMGAAGGIIVSLTASWLPLALRQQWWADAHEYLSIDYDPQAKYDRAGLIKDLVSARTLIFSIACSGICLFLFSTLGLTRVAFVYAALSWALLSIAIIDYDTLYIPDYIVIPIIWAGLIFISLAEPEHLQSHVFGAAIGYCALRLLPIGQGDVKLCAAAGAWLGVQTLFSFLMIGSVFGVMSGLAYYLVRGRSQAYPFGPSLVAAFLVTTAMKLLNFQPLNLWRWHI